MRTGTGRCQASTGVPFLDHMLHQISSHGLIDLNIEATGDTHIDDRHTNTGHPTTSLVSACRRPPLHRITVSASDPWSLLPAS